MKIAVGLSGGVDSAATAALLKEQGHEVIGVTMKIWDGSLPSVEGRSACFGGDEEKDIEDIDAVCRTLGIPLTVVDLSGEYRERILGYFRSEYAAGRTPNPCVLCNADMKFRLLLERIGEAGVVYDRFATGHYARVRFNSTSGRYELLKARYLRKDQSYFLSFLDQNQLAKALFPLGEMTKEEVRILARRHGLSVHDKPESQDFYSGDFRDLLDPMEPGDIVDTSGRLLGRHGGIGRFTIGQRKGLGVSSPEPLYVVALDRESNRVILGGEGDLYAHSLRIASPNWISHPAETKPFRTAVRIRYRHDEAAAEVLPEGDDLLVRFRDPQRSVTPGQIAVLYDGDAVAAGGIISKE